MASIPSAVNSTELPSRMRQSWRFLKNELWSSLCASRQDKIDMRVIQTSKYAAFRRIRYLQKQLQRSTYDSLVVHTAMTLLHRFFVMQSLKDFNCNDMALACLFLAYKTEDEFVRIQTILQAAHAVRLGGDAAAAAALPRRLDPESNDYFRQKEALVVNERILLKTIGFDMIIANPMVYVKTVLRYLIENKQVAAPPGAGMDNAQAARKVGLLSKAWVISSCGHHDLMLLYDARDIAAAFLMGAAAQLKVTLGPAAAAAAATAATAEGGAGNGAGGGVGLAGNAGTPRPFWHVIYKHEPEFQPHEGLLVMIMKSFHRYAQLRKEPRDPGERQKAEEMVKDPMTVLSPAQLQAERDGVWRGEGGGRGRVGREQQAAGMQQVPPFHAYFSPPFSCPHARRR